MAPKGDGLQTEELKIYDHKDNKKISGCQVLGEESAEHRGFKDNENTLYYSI